MILKVSRRRSTEIPKNVISLLKGGLQCEEGRVEERLHGKDNLGEEAAGGGARGREGGGGEEGRRGRGALEQLHDRQDNHRARSASVSAPHHSNTHTKHPTTRTSSFSPGSLALGPSYLGGREKGRLSNFSFRSRASSVSSGCSTPSSASSSPSSESSSNVPSSSSSSPFSPFHSCSTEQFWNQYSRRPPTPSMTKMLKKALTSRLPSRERRAESRESRAG